MPEVDRNWRSLLGVLGHEILCCFLFPNLRAIGGAYYPSLNRAKMLSWELVKNEKGGECQNVRRSLLMEMRGRICCQMMVRMSGIAFRLFFAAPRAESFSTDTDP